MALSTVDVNFEAIQPQMELTSHNLETAEFGSAVLDGTFFRVIKEQSDVEKVVAVCVKCVPKRVEIRGTWKSTSNFKSHLRRKHDSSVLEDYEKNIMEKRKKREQNKLKEPFSDICGNRGRPTVSQESFDRDLTNFVLNSLSPLSIVEDPYLLRMFENLGLRKQVNFMKRRTLGRRIESIFSENVKTLKNSLKKVSHVCTTADIWSAKRRSFFGVTAHWIESVSFERKSASLACRRFRGTHSYDRISTLLQDIQMEYGLDCNKVVATVTDNGSNFVKAFKMFGVKLSSTVSEDSEASSEESDTDTDSMENGISSKINCRPIQLSMEKDASNKGLPHHLRCCAHTLSLCATTDLTKCIKSTPPLDELHAQVMTKCTYLWNAAGRPKSSEVIEGILGHTLSRPGETRWNSLYDSLRQIISIKDKTPELFKALDIKYVCFKQSELNYIEEHLFCVKPLAEALDILQGESNVYYGIALPTLLAVRRKLQILDKGSWSYGKPLVESLLRSLGTRFANILDISSPEAENAAIAAISHPRFKNLWFNCISSIHHKRLITLFTKTVAENMSTSSPNAPTTSPPHNEDFFDFGIVYRNVGMKKTGKAEIQVLQYLDDPKLDLSSLSLYPDIKTVFLKYNTPLPSSAPVERLFSYATMVNCSKSNQLSDEMFEKKVVLKANILRNL